jgi:hypothetical protein
MHSNPGTHSHPGAPSHPGTGEIQPGATSSSSQGQAQPMGDSRSAAPAQVSTPFTLPLEHILQRLAAGAGMARAAPPAPAGTTPPPTAEEGGHNQLSQGTSALYAALQHAVSTSLMSATVLLEVGGCVVGGYASVVIS